MTFLLEMQVKDKIVNSDESRGAEELTDDEHFHLTSGMTQLAISSTI